ncbi:MAG: SDR family oxidoreductase [Deltaproteobacteria bacterium]|nr:SDR family oxidoreductase [Deltaproteobacteria bacterium]
MGRFDGQVVWVTGGGSGIGLACAVEWVKQGAKVAVSGRRVEKLQDAVEAVKAAGGEALAIACDVNDEQACRDAVEEIVAKWGKLDVVLANAGFAVAGYAMKLEPADYRRQFETNVFGLIHTVYAALPELEKTKGRVGLVGSVASFIAPPKMSAYAATKAAVRALGESWSQDLAKYGISVTVLCPGYVASEIQQVNNSGEHNPEAPNPEHPLMVAADVAARDILSAMHKRKLIVPITGHGGVIVWMQRHWPWAIRQALKRM